METKEQEPMDAAVQEYEELMSGHREMISESAEQLADCAAGLAVMRVTAMRAADAKRARAERDNFLEFFQKALSYLEDGGTLHGSTLFDDSEKTFEQRCREMINLCEFGGEADMRVKDRRELYHPPGEWGQRAYANRREGERVTWTHPEKVEA